MMRVSPHHSILAKSDVAFEMCYVAYLVLRQRHPALEISRHSIRTGPTW